MQASLESTQCLCNIALGELQIIQQFSRCLRLQTKYIIKIKEVPRLLVSN